jgi:hypothetical protein
MKRVVGVVVAVLALSSASPAAASEATMATFAGHWLAHGANVTVTRGGLVKETVFDGCCVRVIDVHYKLSNPRGSSSRATADAVVTMVKVGDFSGSVPRVGQHTTFTRRGYNLIDNLLHFTYCTYAAQMKSKCGA